MDYKKQALQAIEIERKRQKAAGTYRPSPLSNGMGKSWRDTDPENIITLKKRNNADMTTKYKTSNTLINW